MMDEASGRERVGGELPDEHYVRLALGGEVGAFDVLIERYKRKLYVYVFNMIGHREDADDVLMDAFIRAYQNLHRFRGGASFSTWLYRIAHNRALDFLRRNKMRQNIFKEKWHAEGEEAGNETAEGQVKSEVQEIRDESVAGDVGRGVQNRELERKLNECLQKLSDNHRAVVVMYDIQGKSHEEIAAVMGCSVGTVRSRLHYAHAQLQNCLKDYLK
ncbi:MAG: sigma-70 family RNA polymerase sigma factor [Methylacidiphilales bacterium]|nr:sigma-70 family RNA polymerase sigma factor [Candidatus Methylacidiphilales bacterium]